MKPIIYTTAFRKNGTITPIQSILTKATQISEDPKEYRKMIGVQTVAEVFKTLDKIQLRKAYHEAIARADLSFDFLVKNLKEIASNPVSKDADRVKALQILLKSLSVDKYDTADGQMSSTWEETLIEQIENEKKLLGEGNQSPEAGTEVPYDVKVPETPERVKLLRQEEKDTTGSIYD